MEQNLEFQYPNKNEEKQRAQVYPYQQFEEWFKENEHHLN